MAHCILQHRELDERVTAVHQFILIAKVGVGRRCGCSCGSGGRDGGREGEGGKEEEGSEKGKEVKRGEGKRRERKVGRKGGGIGERRNGGRGREEVEGTEERMLVIHAALQDVGEGGLHLHDCMSSSLSFTLSPLPPPPPLAMSGIQQLQLCHGSGGGWIGICSNQTTPQDMGGESDCSGR